MCAAPTTPLLTLITLLSSNVLSTRKFSVPMPILLPAETLSGIWETYMSVIIPAVAFATISFVITVLSVTIPI